MGKSEEAHHAVLLPALLLQHDDAVRALVEGGGQALPLRVQRLDPPLQVELALRHYCDLIPDGIIISGKAKRVQVSPESLEMGDVLSHACFLVVHLDDDDDNNDDGDCNADGDDDYYLGSL